MMEHTNVMLWQSLMGEINLQHRCAHLGCQDTATRMVRQEREDSGVTLPAIQHCDNSEFVVNTFSLHNYEIISQLVESHLSDYFGTRIELPSNYTKIRQAAAQNAREPKKKESNTEAIGASFC